MKPNNVSPLKQTRCNLNSLTFDSANIPLSLAVGFMGTCHIQVFFSFFPSVCVEIMYVLLLLLDGDKILELCEVKQPDAVCSMV